MDATRESIFQNDFIPQIGGGVLILVFWHIIACATVMRAFIEWQGESIFSGQLGRHIDFVLTHGKVYQPPRDLAEIDADLDAVSREIMELLQEV